MVDPFNNRRRKWDDIVAEKNSIRDVYRDKALKMAEKNDHEMMKWDEIGASRCRKCGREIHLYNIHTGSGPEVSCGGTKIQGRAPYEKCDEHLMGPYDLPDYRMNAKMLWWW